MKEDVRNVERRSEIKMETLVFFFFFETLVFISENENGKKNRGSDFGAGNTI